MKRHKCSLPVLSIAVVTLCLMLSIVGCGPQPKSLQGSQDKSLRVPKDESLKESFIAFVRHGQIWTARADGTEQKQLTGGKDSSPAVSPDGKTIIYTHDDTIFAIPSAGGNPVRLTPASWLTGSGWTPLFPEDSPSSVLIARDCQQPSFSPDGRFICFILFDALNKAVTSTPHWPQGIAMMNSDGTGEPTILYKVDVMHDEIIPIKCPCFSPDGNYVYVNYGPENTRWQICKQPVKGGNLRGVVGPPGDYSYSGSGNFGIAVSNSLKMIAAVWSVPFDNPIGLDLMGMDGSNRRNLYTLPADSSIPPGVEYGPPSFSPSGKTIAFSARDGRIFLISTNGGKPKEVILDGVQPCFGREPVGESQQSAK